MTTQAQTRLAICLAMTAGYVDAYAFLTYATYVSFMSGNTTQAGSQTGLVNFALAAPAFTAIAFFVIGVFVGTLLMHAETRHARRLVYAASAVLLAASFAATHIESVPAGVQVAILSLAMGNVNTTLSHISAESVSLTFVSGTLNKIGSHAALAIKGEPLNGAQGPGDTHWRRALLLAAVWASFLTGAIAAGTATPHFQQRVLLLPLTIFFILAAFSRPRTAT